MLCHSLDLGNAFMLGMQNFDLTSTLEMRVGKKYVYFCWDLSWRDSVIEKYCVWESEREREREREICNSQWKPILLTWTPKNWWFQKKKKNSPCFESYTYCNYPKNKTKREWRMTGKKRKIQLLSSKSDSSLSIVYRDSLSHVN